MIVIAPATPTNVGALEFKAPAFVRRVFDQNASGQLIEVAFQRLADGTQFRLKYSPVGRIHAEYELVSGKNSSVAPAARKKSHKELRVELIEQQKRTNELLAALLSEARFNRRQEI